ncbi:hypothetical protein ACNQR8_31225, partial [Pseudomonas aeruginosa]
MQEFKKVATTDDLETLGPSRWMEPGFALSSKFQSLYRAVLCLALETKFSKIIIHSIVKTESFRGLY